MSEHLSKDSMIYLQEVFVTKDDADKRLIEIVKRKKEKTKCVK
jgi:hypothetical protein